MSGSATFLTKRVDIEINMFGAVFIDLASFIQGDSKVWGFPFTCK